MLRSRSGSGFHIISDTLTPGIEQFPDKLENGLRSTIDFFTPRTEQYMRTHAKWTDQTGNARNGLRAESSHTSESHGIDVSHSMPYGIWLEIRNAGRLAIIIPTIKTMGAEMMRTIRGLISRLH